jgi:drug/metabolite transporter (DMT)-like permease
MATSMSPLLEPLILATAFVILGIFAKLAARRDNDPALKINDLAVSTSVSLMTLSKIFADLFAAGSPSHELLLAAAVGSPTFLFFVLWERYFSWHEPPHTPPRKKFWWGIVIPNIMAMSVLFLYYWLRSRGQSP